MKKTTKPSVRLQYPQRCPMQFDTRCLDQLLPPDHVARIVWAYVDGLDLSDFLAKVKAVVGGPGQPAIDPRLLLSLWLLATLDGVGSARELDRLCQAHLAYQWLCGGVGVNYHTLADFRTQNEASLSSLLTQSVATLLHQELVDLTEVAAWERGETFEPRWYHPSADHRVGIIPRWNAVLSGPKPFRKSKVP